MTRFTAMIGAQLHVVRLVGHPGHRWAWVVLLLLVVLVVGVTILIVRNLSGPRRAAAPNRAAQTVLAERYARGEIDDDEFRRRRDALRS